MIAQLRAELDAQKLKNNLISDRMEQENQKKGWFTKVKNDELQ